MATNQWIADRRIYLDANGNAVEAHDPARVSLLIAPGQSMSLARALALGLMPADEPKGKPAPANKNKVTPAENK